jgi:hypothetical protein
MIEGCQLPATGPLAGTTSLLCVRMEDVFLRQPLRSVFLSFLGPRKPWRRLVSKFHRKVFSENQRSCPSSMLPSKPRTHVLGIQEGNLPTHPRWLNLHTFWFLIEYWIEYSGLRWPPHFKKNSAFYPLRVLNLGRDTCRRKPLLQYMRSTKCFCINLGGVSLRASVVIGGWLVESLQDYARVSSP